MPLYTDIEMLPRAEKMMIWRRQIIEACLVSECCNAEVRVMYSERWTGEPEAMEILRCSKCGKLCEGKKTA